MNDDVVRLKVLPPYEFCIRFIEEWNWNTNTKKIRKIDVKWIDEILNFNQYVNYNQFNYKNAKLIVGIHKVSDSKSILNAHFYFYQSKLLQKEKKKEKE